MARTLPPHYVPLAYVNNDGKFLEPLIDYNSDSSSIGSYLVSPERSVAYDAEEADHFDVDRQNGAAENKSSKEQSPVSKGKSCMSIKTSTLSPIRKNYLKEISTLLDKKESFSSVKKNLLLAKTKSFPFPKQRSCSQAFPPKVNLKSITKFKIKVPTIRKKRLVPWISKNKIMQRTPSKRKISSSDNEVAPKKLSPIKKNYLKEKSAPLEKKESFSSVEKNLLLAKTKSFSFPKQRSFSQAFPPKANLKSITKFKIKVPIIRKKMLISWTSKNKILPRTPSKRKISSSDNEVASKMLPNQILEDFKLISTVSERGKHKLGNISINIAYKQPSTYDIRNEQDSDVILNQYSAVSGNYVSDNGAQYFYLKKSSDLISYEELSPEPVNAMPADEFLDNSLNNHLSLRKIEKIENGYFHRKDIGVDSNDMSAAEEVMNEKSCIASFVDHRKEIFYFKNVPEEKIETLLSPAEARMSSKNVSINLSPRESLQQLNRRKFAESPNPLKILELKEMLKKTLSPHLNKRRKNTLVETILDEKFPIQQSSGSCTDTNTDESTCHQKRKGFNDNPPKNSDYENSEIKLKPLLIRKKDAELDEVKKWILGMIYRHGGIRYTLEKLYYRYSKINNPWSFRVLRWINSIIPELTLEKKSEINQSGVNIFTMSSDQYHIDNVDNIDVAAEMRIGNVDMEEEIDVETIDGAEDINVEIYEEVSDQSSSQSPKFLQSVFNSPEMQSLYFISPGTKFHSQPTKNQSLDRLLQENVLSSSQTPRNETPGGQTPEKESSDSKSPGN